MPGDGLANGLPKAKAMRLSHIAFSQSIHPFKAAAEIIEYSPLT
jgi:hypothetical protein